MRHLGFFHFPGFQALDPPPGTPIRISANWQDFEPSPGKFTWDCDPARKITAIIESGCVPVPTLRCRSRWGAVATTGKASSPPHDLTDDPIESGLLYSETYSHFISELLTRYTFPLICVENEMNDPDFWKGTTDEYLRLFSTIQAAAKFIEPSPLVIDGGLQGSVLVQLAAANGRNPRRPAHQRAMRLLQGPLYSSWVDVANFHAYQPSESLDDMVWFLRRFTPKPIMSNEVGIKVRFNLDVAASMRSTVAELRRLRVSPVIWFSHPGDEGHNAGALVDGYGHPIEPAFSAFKTMLHE